MLFLLLLHLLLVDGKRSRKAVKRYEKFILNFLSKSMKVEGNEIKLSLEICFYGCRVRKLIVTGVINSIKSIVFFLQKITELLN